MTSLLGIADEDDDGNKANDKPKDEKQGVAVYKGTDEQKKSLWEKIRHIGVTDRDTALAIEKKCMNQTWADINNYLQIYSNQLELLKKESQGAE